MEIQRWLRDEVDTHRLQYADTAGAVPQERWGERPRPGDNSITWLVWHVARWHDIGVNIQVLNRPPVFDEWRDRLGVGPRPGTGFTDDEVDELSAAIDTTALDAYWTAVLDSTVEWLDAVDAAEFHRLLEAPIDTDARWDANAELLPEAAQWVRDFQRASTGARTLRVGVVGHTYWHLGELQTVTAALGHEAR